MSIVLGRPIRAKKQLICRGDEAKVSRILGGRYKGMVERLQDSSKSRLEDGTPTQLFHITVGEDNPSLENQSYTPNTSILYPVFQFLSLRAAGLMFPGNFVTPRFLRLSSEGGRVISAMYSDFVPDDSGRVQRTNDYRRRFYDDDEHATWGEKRLFRLVADDEERKLCPTLLPLVETVEDAGITLAHPEANYQVSGGKIVFFEVQSINPLAAAEYCLGELENTPARETLALIHMVALKEFATLLFRGCPYIARVGEWSSTPLTDLMKVFSLNYGKKSTTEYGRLFHRGQDIVKEPIDHLPPGYRSERAPYPQLPIQIDERIFELI